MPRRAARSAVDRVKLSDEEKREKIVDAALALFAERGYAGTAVPDVIAAAGVGASTLYRLFASKEALVNAVFRHAKGRLGATLADGLDLAAPPRALFAHLWERLTRFARAEPVAFHFLELQDHAPYLDAQGRAAELAVLGPLYLVCHDLQRRGALHRDLPPEVMMALVWGAFVGLIKAERTGYFQLTDEKLRAARDACLRAIITPKA
jgi:AcrR family transcriptional regulator